MIEKIYAALVDGLTIALVAVEVFSIAYDLYRLFLINRA